MLGSRTAGDKGGGVCPVPWRVGARGLGASDAVGGQGAVLSGTGRGVCVLVGNQGWCGEERDSSSPWDDTGGGDCPFFPLPRAVWRLSPGHGTVLVRGPGERACAGAGVGEAERGRGRGQSLPRGSGDLCCRGQQPTAHAHVLPRLSPACAGVSGGDLTHPTGWPPGWSRRCSG